MEKTIRTQFVKEFLEAVLTLESVDECMDFFEDVCTVKEVQSIAQRFAVAKLLKDGKTYAEVANETGCRADRCIHRYDQPCKPVLKLRKCKLR